jgi:iron complex transport system substrate-binding protein
MSGLHRRALRVPVLAALAALLAVPALAACGSGPDAAGGGGSVVAATDTFPVTIEHALGTVTLEEQPARVVSIGYTDHDVLLGLGVVPVGLQQWIDTYDSGVGPWAEEELRAAEPEVFAVADELNFERIAALRPDLIVGVSRALDATAYERLSAIAPTVAKPEGYADYTVPMEEQALVIGKAVGLTAKAGELVAAAEKSLADAARANPGFAGKTALTGMPADDGSFGAYPTADARGRFLTALGLETPAVIDQLGKGEFSVGVSAENLQQIEADVVLALDYGAAAEFTASSVVRELDVARRGDLITIAAEPIGSAFSHNTVLSVPYTVEKLVPVLADALG